MAGAIPSHGSKDAFLWRAILSDDGTDILDEEDADGTPHRFADIPLDRLKAFVLMPQRDHLSAHALHLGDGQRLIFFRRNAVDWNGPQAGIPRVATCVGWQQTVNGQNVKSITAHFDSGASLQTSDESLIEP